MLNEGRGDVHDVAALVAGEHLCDGGAGHFEVASQVDCGDGVVVLVGVVGEWFTDEDAGVVDDCVDSAEPLDRSRDDARPAPGAPTSAETVATSGSWVSAIWRALATTA